MENKKIKVCLFMYGFHNGGIEKVFENYFSHMDLSPFDLHVVTYMEPNSIRQKVFEDMGFTCHQLTQYRAQDVRWKFLKEHIDFFKKNKFDVVHSNMPENIIPLLAARICGIKHRYLHSHNDYKLIFHASSKPVQAVFNGVLHFNTWNATKLLACGEVAAVSAFGSGNYNRGKVGILCNAFDVSRFEYNQSCRDKIRKQLNLDTKFVIGHVGRYETDQKNQEFLLNVFKDLSQIRLDAELLLVGDGKRRSECMDFIKSTGLEERVHFMGNTPKVSEMLQAMDVFCFPSRYEGLGIAAVEAQTAGLPCMISEKVPSEAKITENVKFLPIDSGTQSWVEELVKMKPETRTDHLDQAIRAGYEITEAARQLSQLYLVCE